MSEPTTTLNEQEQKELFKHFKALLAFKRFLESKQLSTYHLRDVVIDTLAEVEKYNLI